MGVQVKKFRRRDGWGESIGYFVVDPFTNCLLSSEYGMDLGQLAVWMRDRHYKAGL